MQPWAGKEAAPAELTEEQKEYIAKLEAEKEAKEGSKKKTDAVRAAPCGLGQYRTNSTSTLLLDTTPTHASPSPASVLLLSGSSLQLISDTSHLMFCPLMPRKIDSVLRCRPLF